MPMLMPTAGTSFPLNMPTSLSYLRAHAEGCLAYVWSRRWMPALCGHYHPLLRHVILSLRIRHKQTIWPPYLQLYFCKFEM